jgi:hypothetical protein
MPVPIREGFWRAPKTILGITAGADYLDGMSISRRAARVAHWLGADEAVISALAWRAAVALCGLVTLRAITTGLTAVEQGYYFTFSSLLGVRVFLDLSFSYVVSVMASHEAAGITWHGRDFRIANSASIARLGTLLRIVSRWYLGGAALLLAGAVVIGSRFFAGSGSSVIWKGPWLASCIAAAVLFTSTPYYSILEGCGQVALVARLRTFEIILSNILFWIALRAGFGLYAAAVPLFIQALYEITLFSTKWRRFLVTIYRAGHKGSVRGMLRELWPFQWKISVSVMSGYFISSMLVPLIFARLGPVQAGQVGMSLAILGAAATLSCTWVNTKAPWFGTLIAQRRFADLDALFRRSLKQGLAIMTLSVLVLIIAVSAIAWRGNSLAGRVVDPASFVLLGGWAIMNVLISSEAIYLRAHKKEPFLILSVLSGLVLSGAAALIVRRVGIRGVALVYFIVGIAFAVYGTIELLRRRRQWHHSPVAMNNADADAGRPEVESMFAR